MRAGDILVNKNGLDAMYDAFTVNAVTVNEYREALGLPPVVSGEFTYEAARSAFTWTRQNPNE